jgi:hypothetical protein
LKILLVGFLLFAGALGIVAGAKTASIFWAQISLERYGPRIISGDYFDADLIAKLDEAGISVDTGLSCRASALRNLVFVRLRIFELASAASDRKGLLASGIVLRRTVRDALMCSPGDSFLWLVQYWLELNQSGLSAKALRFMEASYRYGPNEGWISAKRNRLALAIYDQLPGPLARSVIMEFALLVNSGFYREAVEIIAGPGSGRRDLLLAALASVDVNKRAEFARYLRGANIYQGVPGIISPSQRPWNY